MTLTSADEKVIQKIKDGDSKVYSEQIYVDPAVMPGILVTGLSAIFLLFSVIFPDTAGPFSFDLALFGTLIGICILSPGILVWLYHRNVYSYLGFKRFQIALSITALELSNLGHKNVQPIISPSYPAEYQLLGLFTAIGPGNLLKRIEGVQWDSEALAKMTRQSEMFTTSMNGLVGVLSLLGGGLALLMTGFMFVISGTMNMFLLILSLFIVILGLSMIVYVKRKVRTLKEDEPDTPDSGDLTQLSADIAAKCSVDDVLSLIKLGYSHPIRILVVETYSALEYTERVYYTGDGTELREAYLIPAIGMN